jgi:pyruvate/2-oxoacid:ferredoxin oxidoreductase alpha subunit
MGVRFYRPFPDVAIANALKGKKGVIVLEKALSYGYEGALASDLKSALYEHLVGTGTLPVVQNFILGIGGRYIRTEDLTRTLRAATKGRVSQEPEWIGLKL